MHDAGPLRAMAAPRVAALFGMRTMPRMSGVVTVIVLTAPVVLALMTVMGGGGTQAAPAVRRGQSVSAAQIRRFDPEHAVATDPAQMEALTQDQALVVNAGRPISTLPNPAAQAFTLVADRSADYPRALACLTAAIYYEAAYEPTDGQRAVAQVILNRVRHPLYPHTVCGVVFQGAERATGCQFTFTCDGSLAHSPVARVWDRARAVAAQALSGYVFVRAGLSTHYHADYVVPYWADTMVKTASIGRHAFYRIADGYGRAQAFASPYGRREPAVPLGKAASLVDTEGPTASPSDGASDARPVLDRAGQVVTGALEAAAGSPPTRPWVADLHRPAGRWIIGMDGRRAPSLSEAGGGLSD